MASIVDRAKIINKRMISKIWPSTSESDQADLSAAVLDFADALERIAKINNESAVIAQIALSKWVPPE